MLRKLMIAIDCTNDEERDKVQKILEDFSALKLLSGKTLVGVYPWVKNHQSDLMKLFHLISSNGIKSIASVTGGSIIAKLMRS